jgi:hypothetical protein
MFLLSPEDYLVKKVSKKGRGVFARRDIPAGTLVGDYTGCLLNQKKVDVLEKKCGACYSMDYNNNGLSIFPLDYKAVGVHLINHSCSPNCDTYFYYGHTLFFTLRRILKGEELTIDYGFDPDSEGKKEVPQPCYCGSLLCRGTMYTADIKLKQYGAFCRQETKNQKFESLKEGELVAALDKYPKEIKDNKVFNLFAALENKAIFYQDHKIPPMKELRRRLRATGRILDFVNLGVKVLAIADGVVITKLDY